MAERCSRFAESRDKALELFASKGFGQVGMRELASHLGLTRARCTTITRASSTCCWT
ncbi:hypothetical protein PBOI14_27130 [Pseudomonas sp. Boi14]|nr:hypothetical protein PBOI14_27130 [Pseudomonas sp. Boi14]